MVFQGLWVCRATIFSSSGSWSWVWRGRRNGDGWAILHTHIALCSAGAAPYFLPLLKAKETVMTSYLTPSGVRDFPGGHAVGTEHLLQRTGWLGGGDKVISLPVAWVRKGH